MSIGSLFPGKISHFVHVPAHPKPRRKPPHAGAGRPDCGGTREPDAHGAGRHGDGRERRGGAAGGVRICQHGVDDSFYFRFRTAGRGQRAGLPCLRRRTPAELRRSAAGRHGVGFGGRHGCGAGRACGYPAPALAGTAAGSQRRLRQLPFALRLVRCAGLPHHRGKKSGGGAGACP